MDYLNPDRLAAQLGLGLRGTRCRHCGARIRRSADGQWKDRTWPGPGHRHPRAYCPASPADDKRHHPA